MEQIKQMKALITEPKDFDKRTLRMLTQKMQVSRGPFTTGELLQAVRDVEVLIIRLGHKIDRRMLEAARKLKYILTPTTGLDHIDLKAAEELGITVVSLKGETAFLATIPATAEHTWALLLSLLRSVGPAHRDVLKGNWNRDDFKSHDLRYYKLGILGFGRLGKQISEIAKTFKMDFVFFDTDPSLRDHPRALGTLTDFLKGIDVLSIHIPFNTINRKFLNRQNLKFLKTSSYIINTSRGEVIDEAVIAEMLVQKRLAGYATDVLESEMLPEKRKKSPIIEAARKMDNVIITPHIAGATYESMNRTEEFIIKKWLRIPEVQDRFQNMQLTEKKSDYAD